jgi:lysophospholipase L1-like esterase
LRLRFFNRFGSAPLHIDSVHIARPASPDSSIPGSDQPVTFSGRVSATVLSGADYLSAALSDLAITVHFEFVTTDQTGHPGSRATSYLVSGQRVAAVELPDAKQIDHWYFLEGSDVEAPGGAMSVVTLGDSITDGHGATTNGNDRWPDLLARRLQALPQTPTIAVLNHGIGGNRLLLDGLGPNALARFEDDVTVQAGVRHLIVLEGINDIGMLGRNGDATPTQHQQLVNDIIGAYEQIIARTRSHGISVAGGTLLPFAGSDFHHPWPESEADRQAVNDWIRTPGHFDATIDFDWIMRDPKSPDHLLPKFDSADHLHPSPAGYAASAEAVPVAFLAPATVRASLRQPADLTTGRHH